jgi:hypothetical protein
MKTSKTIFLIGSLFVTLLLQNTQAGEIIGNGTNGEYVDSMSTNCGYFSMAESTDHFHGQMSERFQLHSWSSGNNADSGFVRIKKQFSTGIQRNSYTESIVFFKLYNLTPTVNNISGRIDFSISADGINFFKINSLWMNIGEIGGDWILQISQLFGNNAPQTIWYTAIEFHSYFVDYWNIDSIRLDCGLDYLCFSSYSYPQVIIDDFEGLPNGVQIQNGIVKNFEINQNYPNPFNPNTKIQFFIPKTANTQLVVFDILGNEVEKLIDRRLSSGNYFVDWNAGKYSSGTYFYRLTTEDLSETKKMILVK